MEKTTEDVAKNLRVDDYKKVSDAIAQKVKERDAKGKKPKNNKAKNIIN